MSEEELSSFFSNNNLSFETVIDKRPGISTYFVRSIDNKLLVADVIDNHMSFKGGLFKRKNERANYSVNS